MYIVHKSNCAESINVYAVLLNLASHIPKLYTKKKTISNILSIPNSKLHGNKTNALKRGVPLEKLRRF